MSIVVFLNYVENLNIKELLKFFLYLNVKIHVVNETKMRGRSHIFWLRAITAITDD